MMTYIDESGYCSRNHLEGIPQDLARLRAQSCEVVLRFEKIAFSPLLCNV
jgi:hypothetical protein